MRKSESIYNEICRYSERYEDQLGGDLYLFVRPYNSSVSVDLIEEIHDYDDVIDGANFTSVRQFKDWAKATVRFMK